jgi:hypothetical protein
MKRTSAPPPSRFREPSKYIFQCSGFSAGGGYRVSVHSEMKLVRIWDLMAYRGQNSRSNSPSSTDHLMIHPTVSRLRRISPRGKLETTLILCD